MAPPSPRAPRGGATLKRLRVIAGLTLTLLAARGAADAGGFPRPAGGGQGDDAQEVVVNLHLHLDASTDLSEPRVKSEQCPETSAGHRARGGRVDKDSKRDGNRTVVATPLPQATAVTTLPQTVTVTPLPQATAVTPLTQTVTVTPLPQAAAVTPLRQTEGSGECKDFPKAFSTPYRVLAVGDLHGDIETVKLLLSSLGLIDQEGSWIATRTILVQTGDVLDRGPNGKTLYEFLFRLRAEAKAKDSRIELLLGNHEVLNMASMAMDHSDIFTSKDGSGSEDWAEAITRYIKDWDEFGEDEMDQISNRQAAFDESGALGSELRAMDIMLRLGPGDGLGLAHGVAEGIIFMHANLDPDTVKAKSKRCNCTGQALVNYINGIFHEKLEQDTRHIAEAAVVENLVISREVAQEDENPDLQQALNLLGATRLVLGHTPQSDFLIHKRYKGAVYLIDVGMSRWMNPFGQGKIAGKDRTPAPAALELGASKRDAKALYPGRNLVKAQAAFDALLEMLKLQNNPYYQRTFGCSDDEVRDWTDLK